MISVLTMTYNRHHILEEAIQSFLLQDYEDCEMVILNDANVVYEFDHPKIRIINHPFRFPSLSKKLQFGFSQCKGEHIYRLDDDDLLAPDALKIVADQIKNQGYDVYRAKYAYLLMNNIYSGRSDNVNNGNCYSKEYINRVQFSDNSIVEDVEITFKNGAKIYQDTLDRATMFYRWNGDTFHISALGVENASNSEYLFQQIDNRVQMESGVIQLNPHFKNDYFNAIQGS